MLETKIIAPGRPGSQPRVVALFSYRYDAHLVPDLLANIGPAIHGWAAWDDRAATDQLSSEPARRRLLLQAARGMGADWILAADPDERYEDRLAAQMPRLTGGAPTVWTFDCREMFTPSDYRTDGIWGGRTRARLFPLTADAMVPDDALHGQWLTWPTQMPHRHADLNFYHLRMAHPARRALRRKLYAATDPERRFQLVGYDYLDDERGMVLEAIPPGRGYSPTHLDDGALWAPDGFLPLSPPPDPPHTRLRLMARLAGQPAPQHHVAEDLTDAARDDPDLALIAAQVALTAGRTDVAIAHVHRTLALQPASAAAALTGAAIAAVTGDSALRQRMAELALQAAPDSLIARQARLRALPFADALHHPQALWRRWFEGPATLTEGSAVCRADMAVVVIGFRAPADLARAVQSLRDQDTPTEIIVVNTGGGDPVRILRDHLDHVRLINVTQPCVVGRARNIGIDASCAPIVGFLASDCLALPGWVAHRLRRHQAGAQAVSSAVVPVNPRSLSSLAAACWLHRRRWPTSPDDVTARHGFSYARTLLDSRGYFPIGPQVAEDTVYNERIYRSAPNDWAPEVLTAHAYPTNPLSLIADMHRRGRRRTPGEIAPMIGTGKPVWADLRARLFRRHLLARDASNQLPGLNRLQRALVRQLIRLIRFSELSGIGPALFRLRSAGTVPEQSARSLPMSAPLQMQLAASRERAGDKDGALAAWLTAHALAPDLSAPILDGCRLLEQLGKLALSTATAEQAAIMAPRQEMHMRRVRSPAIRSGQMGLALMSAQVCLLNAPWDPTHHRNLAQVYRAMGNDRMVRLREGLANRLELVS
jgi:glycosyltransferase involved in cell wall biosynthesis